MPPPSSTEVADRQFADSSDSPPLPPQPLSAVRAPRVMAAVSSRACFFIVVLAFRTFALTPVRPRRRLRSLLSVGVFRATTTIGKPPPFAKSDNRSEERRVGKEGRTRRWADESKKRIEKTSR